MKEKNIVNLNYYEIKKQCAGRRLLIDIYKKDMPKQIYNTLVACNSQLDVLNEILGKRGETITFTYGITGERDEQQSPD